MALSSASASSASAAHATDADGCAAATMRRVLGGGEFGFGCGVAGQQYRIRSQEITHRVMASLCRYGCTGSSLERRNHSTDVEPIRA